MKNDVEARIVAWLAQKINGGGHGVQKKLAQYLGIDPGSVNRMLKPDERGRTRRITLTELVEISRFFNEPPPNVFSDVDREFLDYYSGLSDQEKLAVKSYMHFLLHSKGK